MNVDHFYTKGSTHRVNQDYAISGLENRYNYIGKLGSPYAIISDGCSSVPDADVGARLIARCAAQYLYFGFHDLHLCKNIVSEAKHISGQLDLDESSLCATMLAIRTNKEQYEVLVSGDGVVITKQNNSIVAIHYQFESGAPYYLRYLLNHEAELQYRTRFPGNVIRTTYIWGEKPSAIQETLPIQFVYTHAFNIKDTEFVAIATDGVGSFYQTNKSNTSIASEQVPWTSIIPELTAFKGYQGEFVHRRCNKALDCFKNKNWVNHDDFSLAAIATL